MKPRIAQHVAGALSIRGGVMYVRLAHPTASELRSFAAVETKR
jgi:hypothetical protein